jgi:hypothetical protein
MRSLAALCSILAAGVVAAQDPPKHDLLYRWDQLDGKTAVYEVELTSVGIVDRKATTEASDDKGSPDAAETKMESISTTKQRVAMAFKAGDGGRGLVTVTNLRVQQSLTQKALGETTTVSYDSANPPKDGVPEKLKAAVTALIAKPYTLTVTRRGVVEKVEGRPSSELPSLKGTFLLFPEVACAVSQSWNDVRRHETGGYGDIVERVKSRLARVDEKGGVRIEQTIETELDTSSAKVPRGTIVRIDNPTGKAHALFDARGLRLEADREQSYEFYLKQFSEGFEHRTKVVASEKWKLVEVKDAR